MNMAPNTEWLENVTYDELSVGQSARLLRTLTQADIQAFAAVSGDTNPAHLNHEYANDTLFHGVIAHGMWGGALISALLGTQFPGPGTIYVDQALHFAQAVPEPATANSVSSSTRVFSPFLRGRSASRVMS